MPLEKTRRVSRSSPCSVCGRPDWCLAASDGRYTVCMRVVSERPALGGLGGWIHRTGDARPMYESSRSTGLGRPSQPEAPRERRHAVYRRLQANAVLRTKHLQAMEARGCTRDEVAGRGYATLPLEGRAAIARCCHNGAPESLDGVPGFFRKQMNGPAFWTLAGSPGMLIPCLDPRGSIRAFTIRHDEPAPTRPKYTWFSSKDKPGGSGSGIHCHVARPLGGGLTDAALWITEGPLKADIASQRLGAVVLAIPGVSAWAHALPDVVEILPPGGRVVVAMDADWRTNPAVHAAVWGLTQGCIALGYQVEAALWEATHKGLDNLLTAGLTPDLHGPEAIPAPRWTLKVSSRILAQAPQQPAATQPSVTLPAMRDALRNAFRASLSPQSA